MATVGRGGQKVYCLSARPPAATGRTCADPKAFARRPTPAIAARKMLDPIFGKSFVIKKL
jgi:hypothetical protein